MAEVAARELRNHTSDVLRRAANGERLTVTHRGRPVAEIGPVATTRPAYFSTAEMVNLFDTALADPGLREDLANLAGDSTDDLGPIA